MLPATSFLESEDIRDYCHRGIYLAVLANKAIEPVGQSMEDWKIWAELCRRMGYAEYFPWKDTDELLDY